MHTEHSSEDHLINVSFWSGGGFMPCGRIEFNRSASTGSFEYEKGWNGPPLDPVHLDYVKANRRRFEVDPSDGPDLLHRVFIDSLPGVWGQNLLAQEFPEFKHMCAAERLHWFGTRTIGSLAFHVHQTKDEVPVRGIERLEEIRKRSVQVHLGRLKRIGDLHMAPGKGATAVDVMEGLSAFGGARPKCLFEDHTGGQWLAKFNVDTDPYNFARVEHAVAKLSLACGIDTVETQAHPTTDQTDVLFVRRFDRDGQARRHRISLFSLMHSRIVKHHGEGDYAMIFDVLQKVSCDPKRDTLEMVRRMLFNVAVNNSDDHLKNHELILDEDCQCYNLSPAFDVTIDPYPSHRATAVFGIRTPGLSDQLMNVVTENMAKFGVDEHQVLEARDAVVQGVGRWRQAMRSFHVSPSDVAKLGKRLDLVSLLASSPPVKDPLIQRDQIPPRSYRRPAP